MIKKVLGAIAITSSALIGCKFDPNIRERAQEYMQDKPIKEYEQVINGYYSRYTDGHQTVQSKLDSVAFRDVFNGTNGVKDSSKVAEFNKIASTNRYSDIRANLKNTGISVKEYNKIIKESNNLEWNFSKQGVPSTEHLQFKTDSIQYRKFFEKHNLLNEKTLKHFNNVCKKIKP